MASTAWSPASSRRRREGSRRHETSIWRCWLAIALAAVALSALAACGDEERLSREAFDDRLESIDRQGSERYARLEDLARSLKPDQPLTQEVKLAMRRYAAGLSRLADRLEEITPPVSAERATATLVDALRERASAFQQAAQQERTTLSALERQGSVTNAGDGIDRAFEQLRQAGFSNGGGSHE
jgi:exonuclease VII large subunit